MQNEKTGANLNSISSSISRCLAAHKLESIAPTTNNSSQHGNPAPIPVPQVPPQGRLGAPKSGLIQEAHVDDDGACEERQGEVEERCVDHQFVDTWLKLVPLVVC